MHQTIFHMTYWLISGASTSFPLHKYTYYMRKKKKIKQENIILVLWPIFLQRCLTISTVLSWSKFQGTPPPPQTKNKLPSSPADVVLLLLVYSVCRLGHRGVLYLTSNLENFRQSWFPLIRIKQRTSQICEKLC